MSTPLLACRGLEIRAGARCLVRALDFDVAAGERWALIGPNGAGKTSLLLVLAGARPAQAGTVLLCGRPLQQWSVENLAGLRAMVADRWIDPFATSVLDTVLAARYRLRGPRDRAGARDDATATAEAVARDCLVAMDCLHLAGRDVRYLSRGERQRVALAAALAQETGLVLLDEPISHQDPRHQIQVLQALQDRAACTAARTASCTYVGALHDINAAVRFATHALLLHGDGRWVAGRAADVLTQEKLSPLFETPITEVHTGSNRVFLSHG
jgi:iron complex transport system ATP-binding protein